MASFREIRSILLQSFDDGDISEDEFLLLYDVNTSKNPDFPYEGGRCPYTVMRKRSYSTSLTNRHVVQC